MMCYLLKYRMSDTFVTPAGGLEEDVIRCLGGYKLGAYHGNLYVPLAAQDKFKAWFKDQIRAMRQRQDIGTVIVFTASSIIRELSIANHREQS